MLHSDGVRGTPPPDFDTWRALLRSNCEVEVTAPSVFAGSFAGHRPASWRDRLRLRLSGLCTFRAKIPQSVCYAPGGHVGHGQRAGDGIVRAGTGGSASLAYEVQAPAS
jgi:hypothetical protein